MTAMYFSATGTTQKVVLHIARSLSLELNSGPDISCVDFTLPRNRMNTPCFTDRDVVVLGVPVYAGRVPNVLVPYLKAVTGGGALAIAVVVYGNRNYDDALIELTDLLRTDGFHVVAGAAFIGEHSFSEILARNRPDAADLATAQEFSRRAAAKILTADDGELIVRGNRPYRKHYMPLNKNGEPVDIRKVAPKTSAGCNDCKVCVEVCPMGSINSEDVSRITGICIKCGACIKKCPMHAKYYEDDNYLRHKRELEVEYAGRQEPELFL